MEKKPYNLFELMASVAAREIEDRAVIYIGTGIPMLAASLAQNMHAPNIVPVFEAGGVAPQMPTLPLSVGCSRTTYRAIRSCDMPEIFEMAQLGVAHYAFLGGAQVDQYGNLNSTVKGTYERPQVRWPGSGGANAFGSLCWRTMIIINHEKRRFVEKVDFITTPGYLDGPGARERAGLPPGTGPYRVFTDKALLDFDEKTKRMRVIGLLPGVTLKEVVAATDFELLVKDDLKDIPAPTDEELKVLREKVDPYRIVLSRGDQQDGE
jgi:glutaconate CoA-transferase subunit B